MRLDGGECPETLEEAGCFQEKTVEQRKGGTRVCFL